MSNELKEAEIVRIIFDLAQRFVPDIQDQNSLVSQEITCKDSKTRRASMSLEVSDEMMKSLLVARTLIEAAKLEGIDTDDICRVGFVYMHFEGDEELEIAPGWMNIFRLDFCPTNGWKPVNER